MAFTLTSILTDVAGNPIANQTVIARAASTPYFQLFSSVWKEVSGQLSSGGQFSTQTDVNGSFTFTLPWPSTTWPANLQWQVVLPDGTIFQGVVPEGDSTTRNLQYLASLAAPNNWVVVAGAGAKVGSGLIGPAGPAGATGPQGVAGAGASVATTAAIGSVKVDNNAGGNPIALTTAGMLASILGLTTANLAPGAGVTLSQLGASGATANQVPQWNGTAWVPGTVSVSASAATTTVLGTVKVDNNAGGSPVAITTTGMLTSIVGLTTSNLAAAAGILGSQLAAAAGITSGQIASVAASTITGTVADGSLSSNVALLNAAQTFTALKKTNVASGNIYQGQTAGVDKFIVDTTGAIATGIINPSSLTGSGTVPLAALSGITHTQLAGAAGILPAQISASGSTTGQALITPDGNTVAWGSVGATSPFILSAQTATQIPLIVRGFASQTADLFEAQNSASTVLFKIDASGNITAVAGTFSGLLTVNVASGNIFTGQTAGVNKFVIDGTGTITTGIINPSMLTGSGYVPPAALALTTGVTNNMVLAWQTGGAMAWVGQSGGATSPLVLTSTAQAQIPLTLKGIASQTGDLLEFQNSTGTILGRVDKVSNISAPILDTGGAVINVKAAPYGAVGNWNGSTGNDDTAAFVAAIAALPTQGGKLIIPPGQYKVTQQLKITVPVTIEGSASGNRYSESNAFNPISYPCIIYFTGDTSGFVLQGSYNRVRDIELTGTGSGGVPTYAGGTSDGLVLMGGDSLIDNVACSYFSRDGFHCENNLPSSTSDNSIFLRCIAVGNKRHGYFNQGGDSQNMAFHLCNASANGIYGFYNGSAASLVVSATTTTVTVTAGDGKLFQPKTILNVDPNVTANKRVISSISSSGLGDVLTLTPAFSTTPTANQLLRGGAKASTLASVNGLVSCTVAAGDGVLFSNQRPTQPMTFMLITAASVTQNGTGTISGDTITWTTAPGTTPNVGDMIYINGAPAGSNHNSFYSCHHNSNGIGAVYENGTGNTYIHFYAEGGTGSLATIGKESSSGTWLHNGTYADVTTFTIDALAKPSWWVQRSGKASLPGAIGAASVTTVNSVIPYYDAGGTLLGYIPIYTTHT